MKNIILLLLLTSCVSTTTNNKDTVNIAVPGEPLSLDPFDPLDGYSLQVRAQIYNTLITKDTNGEFVGELAESWQYITPTQLRITLKSNIYFHNGESFTPKDVKYSIERQQSSIPNKDVFKMIERVETGSNSVDLYLFYPFVPLLDHLTLPNAYIVNQKAIESTGDYRQESPVGTGAYQFESWNRGYQVSLIANTNFFLGNPSIKRLVFNVVPDETSRTIALETGDVQIARDISLSESINLAKNPKYKVFDYFTPIVTYLSVNTTNGIMTNINIRKAMALALDRKGMVDSIYFGKAKSAYSLIPFNTVGFSNLQYAQDIQKAKELVRDAGATDSKLILYSLGANHLKLAEIIQANLREIGLNIEIQVLELSTFLQLITEGAQHLYLLNWTTLTGDGDFALTQLLSQESPWNNTEYQNPTIQQLLIQARGEFDTSKRLTLYQQLQGILNQDLPYIPIVTIATVNGSISSIEGIGTVNGASALNLQKIYYK